MAQRPTGNIVDCKSLYDPVCAQASVAAGVTDRFTSIDLTILKQAAQECSCGVRWSPGHQQVADGLTKDAATAADVLRGALRAGRFEIAEEDLAGRGMGDLVGARQAGDNREGLAGGDAPGPELGLLLLARALVARDGPLRAHYARMAGELDST